MFSTPKRRSLWLALIMAVLASVLPLMHTTRSFVHEALERRLSAALGLPVSFSALEAGFGPSLTVRDMRVGTLMRCPRVDLILRADADKPLRAVRLFRPHFSYAGTRIPAVKGPAKAAAQRIQRDPISRRLQRLGESLDLEILDGYLEIAGTSGGHSYEAKSAHIYLQKLGVRRRLIVGETSVKTDFGSYHTLGAALDLELRRFWVPQRGAALVGTLTPKRGPRHRVHAMRLRRRNGQLLIKADLAAGPAKHSRVTLEVAIGPAAPRGVEFKRAELDLRRVLASQLQPLLPAGHALTLKGGFIDASLRIRREQSRLSFGVTARANDVVVSHGALAAQPVTLKDGMASAHGSFDTATGIVNIERLDLRHGALSSTLNGAFDLRSRQGTARVSLASISCQKALDSIPPGLAPSLRGAVLAGEIGLRASIRLGAEGGPTEMDFRVGRSSCRVLVDPPRANVLTLLRPDLRLALASPVRGRQPILDRSSKAFVPLRRIPLHLRSAFITAEDSRFFNHRGFDLKQIKRALRYDVTHQRFARGASTISQQLVKNVFLHHGRTVARKLQEAALTWRLEQRLSKGQILELYLNMVEMGPGLRGIQPAALAYFGKDVRKLDPLQAVHLAALTPSPRRYSRRIAKHGLDRKWRAKLQMLLGMMRRAGAISDRQERRLRNAPLGLLSERSAKRAADNKSTAALGRPVPSKD